MSAATSGAAKAAAMPASRRGQIGGLFSAVRNYPVPMSDDMVQRARIQRQQIERPGARLFGADVPPVAELKPSWVPLGPGIVNGLEGTASGRVTAIATDPRNPDTVYIGASGGGVWKSSNAGITWQSLGDNMPTLMSGSLALDPRDGMLWYGTGDYGAQLYGAGVFRSPDGGGSWVSASGWSTAKNKPQLSGGYTHRVVLHPTDPQTVLLARNSGAWRSRDGGNTWDLLLPWQAEATDLLVDPSNPNRIYVALGTSTGDPLNGVYRTDDGGANGPASWIRLGNVPYGAGVGRISLGLSPSNPGVLYATFASPYPNSQLMAAFRTNNGGNTWASFSAPPTLFDSAGRGQGHFDNYVAVGPGDSNTVYLGGVELWKSTDGGGSWNVLSLNGNTRVIHEDQFALAFRPGSPNVIYAGNDGGIYRSMDSGQSWLSLNSELPITQFNSITSSPINPLTLLGGTQDQGLVRFNGTRTWDQLLRGDAGVVLYGLNDSTVYTAKQFIRPMASIDGGATFGISAANISQLDRVAFYPPMAASRTNPQTIFFGTHRVWQSADGGNSWAAISGDLTKGAPYYLTALAVGPTSTVYAGSFDGRVSFTNGGGAWISGAGIPNRSVTSITPDPQNGSVAYLTVSNTGTGHVFKTQDGGQTWSDISGTTLPDAPANSTAIGLRGEIYVGTDVGVFRTDDGSNAWSSYNLGLPNAVVSALTVNPLTGKLIAATYGRGVFQIENKAPQSSGPSLFARSVVNAFSLEPAVAPGMTATAYGTRLTVNETASAGDNPAPSLAGTSVTVNGTPAPLFFASPDQLNFQVPFEISGTMALVVITTPEGSAGLLVPLMPAVPGLLGGSVKHSNWAPVDENNPAAPGENLILFATGLGVTSPAVATGAPAPTDSLAPIVAPASFTFGGQTGTLQFAGLAPGYAALYQVNLQVPTNVTGNVLLSLTVGGHISNTLTVPVR